MVVFSIEANIGGGKTTLLERLKHVEFHMDHVVLLEPVDEWLNFKPEGEDTPSLFEKYYSNKKRYGFMFQMYALQTRINHLLNTIKMNPGKIIICERTHFTDAKIFARMLAEDGYIDKSEYYVYKSWYEQCKCLLDSVVKGIIYLRTSVPTCMTRIAKRNRDGEDTISVNYIKRLHDLHEDWLLQNQPTEIPIQVIDGDVAEEEVNVSSIVEFINRLSK